MPTYYFLVLLIGESYMCLNGLSSVKLIDLFEREDTLGAFKFLKSIQGFDFAASFLSDLAEGSHF